MSIRGAIVALVIVPALAFGKPPTGSAVKSETAKESEKVNQSGRTSVEKGAAAGRVDARGQSQIKNAAPVGKSHATGVGGGTAVKSSSGRSTDTSATAARIGGPLKKGGKGEGLESLDKATKDEYARVNALKSDDVQKTTEFKNAFNPRVKGLEHLGDSWAKIEKSLARTRLTIGDKAQLEQAVYMFLARAESLPPSARKTAMQQLEKLIAAFKKELSSGDTKLSSDAFKFLMGTIAYDGWQHGGVVDFTAAISKWNDVKGDEDARAGFAALKETLSNLHTEALVEQIKAGKDFKSIDYEGAWVKTRNAAGQWVQARLLESGITDDAQRAKMAEDILCDCGGECKV